MKPWQGRERRSDPLAVPSLSPNDLMREAWHQPQSSISGPLCAKCPIPKHIQAHCWPETSPARAGILAGNKTALPNFEHPRVKARGSPQPPTCPHLTLQLGQKLPALLPSTSINDPKLGNVILGKCLTGLQRSRGADRAEGQQKCLSRTGTEAKASLQDKPRPRSSFRD